MKERIAKWLVGKRTIILVLGSIVGMWVEWLTSEGVYTGDPPLVDTPEAIIATAAGCALLTFRASIDRWTSEIASKMEGRK